MPIDDDGAVVAMTAGGVTALIDATGGRLPVLAYWGPELRGLDAGQAAALLTAAEPVTGSNTIEPRPRVAVLPEHHTGWVGRPGLSGSYAGVGWSPAFRTTTVTVGGTPAGGFVAAGAGTVEVEAVDDSGRLALRLTIELLPAGLLRMRAHVTSTTTPNG